MENCLGSVISSLACLTFFCFYAHQVILSQRQDLSLSFSFSQKLPFSHSFSSHLCQYLQRTPPMYFIYIRPLVEAPYIFLFLFLFPSQWVLSRSLSLSLSLSFFVSSVVSSHVKRFFNTNVWGLKARSSTSKRHGKEGEGEKERERERERERVDPIVLRQSLEVKRPSSEPPPPSHSLNMIQNVSNRLHGFLLSLCFVPQRWVGQQLRECGRQRERERHCEEWVWEREALCVNVFEWNWMKVGRRRRPRHRPFSRVQGRSTKTILSLSHPHFSHSLSLSHTHSHK